MKKLLATTTLALCIMQVGTAKAQGNIISEGCDAIGVNAYEQTLAAALGKRDTEIGNHMTNKDNCINAAEAKPTKTEQKTEKRKCKTAFKVSKRKTKAVFKLEKSAAKTVLKKAKCVCQAAGAGAKLEMCVAAEKAAIEKYTKKKTKDDCKTENIEKKSTGQATTPCT